MGRKKDVERLFHQTLSDKIAFGQSKKAAKKTWYLDRVHIKFIVLILTKPI